MQEPQLEKHLNGQYNFNVKSIVTRATEMSRANTFTIFTALALMLALTLLFSLVLLNFYEIQSLEQLLTSEDTGLGISFLLFNILLAPMWGGIAMMSLYTLRGSKISTFTIFSFFSLLPQLGLVSLLVDTFSQVGLQLLVIPAFYVYMVSTFIVPLIIDKKLHPFKAIVMSVKMTNAYITQMALIYLIFLALMIAGIISFFLGFIWIIPFIYNVKAVLYQDLFCDLPESTDYVEGSTGTFDA